MAERENIKLIEKKSVGEVPVIQGRSIPVEVPKEVPDSVDKS